MYRRSVGLKWREAEPAADMAEQQQQAVFRNPVHFSDFCGFIWLAMKFK